MDFRYHVRDAKDRRFTYRCRPTYVCFDFPSVITLDQDVPERKSIWYPFKHTAFFVERHDSVCSNILSDEAFRISDTGSTNSHCILTHVSLPRLRTTLQEFIDHRIEIHQSSVLSQVIVRFNEERVFLCVVPYEEYLLWSLERCHNVDLIAHAYVCVFLVLYSPSAHRRAFSPCIFVKPCGKGLFDLRLSAEVGKLHVRAS